MKRAGYLGLLGLLLALPGGADETSRTFPYDVHSETLDNGLEVVLVPMSSGGLLSYWTIVRTGARDEYEPGRTGFAHFFEHMMFRGTKNFPAEIYNEMLTGIGADFNAFTTDDLTAYYMNVAAEDVETVMKLESDRFKNLDYSKQVFQTEAGAVYGEYRKTRTNPFFTIFEAVRKEAFDEHTYGHTAMGYVEDIQRMPELYDYSRSFFSRYYRPENAVLFLAGDIEVEPTMALVRQYYGDWEAGYVPPKVETEPPQQGERRIDVAYDGSSLPIVWLAYKADAFSPEDRVYMAGRLLCELAFGETSTIYKKLVLNEQVLEFLNADLTFNRDPGLIDIYARVKDPEKVDYVISEIDRVVEGVRQEPPDPQRLADLKSRVRYSFLMSLDTPSNVAGNLSRIVAVSGGLEAVDKIYATLEQVTPQDVVAAAEKYLLSDRRTVAVLRGDS